MFRSRFIRIFRIRNRRPVEKDDSSAEVTRRSSGSPLAQSHHQVSSKPEPIDTTFPPFTSQPHPVFSDSPGESPTQGTLTPFFVVAPDQQSTPQTTPIPPLRGNVGPQIYLDGALLVESPPVQKQLQTHTDTCPRHVCFQLPTPHIEDALESPLSPCSTLIAHDEDADPAGLMKPELPVTPEAYDSVPGPAISSAPDAQTNNSTSGVRFDPSLLDSSSGRARHKSLFNPQPVQADMNRFSMSPTRSAPSLTPKMNLRDGRRQTKRASTMPFGSGLGARQEKRQSRWSKETSKPATQKVLRTLSGI